eukprot:2508517-Amphidinium_carterae.1
MPGPNLPGRFPCERELFYQIHCEQSAMGLACFARPNPCDDVLWLNVHSTFNATSASSLSSGTPGNF